MSEPLIAISLGAGVQSSTLYRMSATGALPRAHVAIFADTQAEPQAVYDNLDRLERDHGHAIPIVRVTAGSLEYAVLHPPSAGTGHVGQPPFYILDPPDGKRVQEREGRLWRKCTKDFKLVPLRQETRRQMEARGLNRVEQWIGISLDEVHRMKDSSVGYIVNRYPLIETRMSRHDCLRWLETRGYPRPPKSACRWCPFMNDSRWREMRAHQPEEWEKAVEFDSRLRDVRLPGVRGTAFVHRSLIPLSRVDLSNEADHGQLDLFGNECEGMCGV